jgi:chromosome segregation ATPase
MEHEVNHLKQVMEEIKNKLAENHDVHIRNEETLKNILTQTTKTNGRVGILEGEYIKMDKTIALLSQIVSQQHHQYENWVIRQEKLQEGESEVYASKEEIEPVKKIVYGLVGLLLTGVVGSILALVLK